VRRGRCAGISALCRAAADAGARWSRQPVWRAARRHRVHDRAPPVVGPQSAVLAILAGHVAGVDRSVRARRNRRRLAPRGAASVAESSMSAVLQTRGLVKCFGRFVATNDVNLSVRAGARHALIGPNGAGKTTLINLLTGFLDPSAGDVLLKGEVVTRLPQHRRVQRGLVRTFQINRLVADLTVLESVLMAVNERLGLGARFWRPVGAFGQAVDEAATVLQNLNLLEVAHERTRNLPYGKQRLVEIALALAARPEVLLLDEPAAGVPAGESRELFEAIALLVTLMGATRRRRGNIVYRGSDLVAVPTHGRASLGLGWVPQERDIFASLSVQENLTVVARPGPWDLTRVYALFPRLGERRS